MKDHSCPYCGHKYTDFEMVHSPDGSIPLGYDYSWCYECGGEWYQNSTTGLNLFLLSDELEVHAPLTARVKEAIRKRTIDRAFSDIGRDDS